MPQRGYKAIYLTFYILKFSQQLFISNNPVMVIVIVMINVFIYYRQG